MQLTVCKCFRGVQASGGCGQSFATRASKAYNWLTPAGKTRNGNTSSSMALATRWLLSSFLILEILSPCCVLAQAPGDENEFCLDISSAPAYASSVKPLLDSWRYTSLLGVGGVWTTRQLDNDTDGVR